ncbi:hypothetical protein FQN57_004719 [Myotisia sp. PD_48]|nr:hypothetical protein FQN57_004719 [Myotisia sp. PD_48]
MGELDFTTFHNVINGKLTSTAETRHNINPATGEPNAEVPVSTAADVDAAMDAAQAAFKTWSKTPWAVRQKALNNYADAVDKYRDQFAQLLTREQGKPLPAATGELMAAPATIRTIAALELLPEFVEDTEEQQIVSRYTPLGVVVGIVPWNFPVALAMNKLAPAVLTGNTVILKPSPFTPYCGLKLVELAQQFFPPGVVQVLSGSDSLGPLLTAHPVPAKISFTGSTATGKRVMESASKTLKRVTLELGGNDPAIICGDVDVDVVAPKVAGAAFANSGQVCIAVKRIFVHESIYDKFRDAMVKAVKGYNFGNGCEAGVSHGPVQNAMQFERVKGFFADIEKEKWNVATGGAADVKPAGYFVEPTIIDNPPRDSRIVTEEPFGPIVPLVSWKDEEEVIREANNTDMGLGASVWSKDIFRATQIGAQLEAGSVWINAHLALDRRAPFGGHKQSGIGYEGGLGGLKSYCNAQAMYIKKKALL